MGKIPLKVIFIFYLGIYKKGAIQGSFFQGLQTPTPSLVFTLWDAFLNILHILKLSLPFPW